MPDFPDNITIAATLIGTGHGGADGDDWKREANAWRVTVHCDDRGYSFDYWMGSGLGSRPPARDEVLDNLQSDCRFGDESFDDFCADLGYDTDSRRAYATWEACRDQMFEMRRLFGRHYETFLDYAWEG